MSTPTLNQYSTNTASRILSVGGYRPSKRVTNDDLAGPIDSSDEWIRQRTGIVTRQRADADTSLVGMALAAGQQAIERAGIETSDIGAVVVATVTFPYPTGSAAAIIAGELGIHVPAYDISAACAGYCYGVAQADSLVRSGMADYVLVIGAEKLSDFVDPTDRSISFLLGDGAGAVVVGASQEPGISKSNWGSKGEDWDMIRMTRSSIDMRNIIQEVEKTGDATAIVEPGSQGSVWPTLRQEGPSVFRWAVWEMAKVAKQTLADAGIESEDLAAFLPHQANMRIIDEFAKQLKLPEHVAIGRDIADAGNTSAASIPLAMHRLLEEQPELSGGLALQIGFGAGLVYGAQVVRLP
ncbi:beta-ketoacyl-ACP synthase III [Enteractinococcus coprophilus]|uniref:Beta-ketoacyl-[acyl-carrier-protein] synthase III n=1 Tax=Enteractinococcus coprophilus TaxID=1027633 RepID=A0A543AIP9_9MICC|nr:beta-ketoacyl-ACP synthase III [Enteractinococcus coprophilus]TQL72452.1 3-oxoacyl-[acyl-carrier-protein] synthase-3 [Enteractinococcus coprophilus]